MKPEEGVELFMWNIIISSTELFFSTIFLIELILKVFAKSLFYAKRSFFRKDGFWNTIDGGIIVLSFIYSVINFLDFFILGVFGILLEDNDTIIGDFFRFFTKMHTGKNLGSLETLYRIYGVFQLCQFLLPLRGLLFIPLIRVLVESIVSTLPFLMSIVFIIILVICLFSILGMSGFSGVLHRRCVSITTFDSLLFIRF